MLFKKQNLQPALKTPETKAELEQKRPGPKGRRARALRLSFFIGSGLYHIATANASGAHGQGGHAAIFKLVTHALQVRAKDALGLSVRVAYHVAHLRGFSAHITLFGHCGVLLKKQAPFISKKQGFQIYVQRAGCAALNYIFIQLLCKLAFLPCSFKKSKPCSQFCFNFS